jgi:hypothetical protein
MLSGVLLSWFSIVGLISWPCFSRFTLSQARPEECAGEDGGDVDPFATHSNAAAGHDEDVAVVEGVGKIGQVSPCSCATFCRLGLIITYCAMAPEGEAGAELLRSCPEADVGSNDLQMRNNLNGLPLPSCVRRWSF